MEGKEALPEKKLALSHGHGGCRSGVSLVTTKVAG